MGTTMTSNRNGVTYMTILAVFLLSLVFAACTAAPFTQRRQVMLVSETQEIALGIELYREILRQSILKYSDAFTSTGSCAATRRRPSTC